MVNLRVAVIFKGIFETQKSTRNGENFAKSGALGTWAPAIYHPRINYAAPPFRLYHALRGRDGKRRESLRHDGGHGKAGCGRDGSRKLHKPQCLLPDLKAGNLRGR
jgi:hypothetical protein